MHLVHSYGKHKLKKIIKELNHYWYDECPSTYREKEKSRKKSHYNHTVFSCEYYTFGISPYGFNMWFSENITDVKKEEVRKIIDIIFCDNNGKPRKKLNGYFSESAPNEQWFVELLNEYENIHRHKPSIRYGGNVDKVKIDDCIDFVEKLEVEGKEEDIKSALLQILNTVKVNY